MADAATGAPQIQGTLPLYKKPEPLNVQAHKGMGLKYGDRPFDFLNETHFVPLTVGEFAQACGVYPIIFLGDGRIPAAVMGLQPGQNLFVDPKTGNFEQHAYLPVFVRRYPFVAATHTDDNERFTLCVDAGSHLMSDNPDQPFFDENGQLTPFVQNAIEFIQNYETDVRTTNLTLEELKSLDLFEEQNMHFQPRDQQGQPVGEPQRIASYWGISHEKLRALPGEKLAELRDSTVLGAIYAHMLSMSRWEFIIARAAARAAGSAQPPQPGVAPPPPEA
ncbi:MAG: SapC family protein [Oceanicaulis sp.]|uniref:SapC family protein n=1 Tax=Glycocaulis sp. TaxID=1969725 RepID=UPI0025BA5618|nr:SapC family protein [Glycocaulis sp.]MCC5981759.1 SapC family protein [Oceanicaulis sp.]MCH8520467.1 SapC family protein [Glycocaulis sp.]